MIVFIDTNIFLDVLLNREGLVTDSETVLNRCSKPGYSMYTSSISFTNITYFLTKYRPAEAKILLEALLKKVYIAQTQAKDFQKALQSNFHDLEDAYQYYTALQIRGIKYFITRNIKHYKHSVINVVTPGTFLSVTQGK